MNIILWIGFIGLIVALLTLDLGVFNRKSHVISVREALLWTLFWIVLALIFNVGLYFMYEHHLLGIGTAVGHNLNGQQAALQYFTGYLLEKSLSLDNIFVIALILGYFNVPQHLQHRVLFWGIAGAIILRGILILTGAALLERFFWMSYVFGILLILTAGKLLFSDNEAVEPEKNPLLRLARRFYPVTKGYDEERFFTRIDGKRAITPLFLVLLVVESSDVMFALDSIPAIFAVTYDPFIVFTSNIFAILGLRSLYFALAAVMAKFRYLKVSLVVILGFVGTKMILSRHYHINTGLSLAFIVVSLSIGAIASILAEKRMEEELR